MKKTAIAMLALTVGIMAASCQKEYEPEVKTFEPMTINAVSEGIGTATKTEMAYKYDILWSEDDQIYVTDGTSNDIFTLSVGQGTTKGTFTQDGTAEFTGVVEAFYPQSLIDDGSLVWPAVQTNDQTVPMYSTKDVASKVESFNFASLGSVLQIVFNSKQEGITLKSITLKDDTNPLSGTFTVDEVGKAVMDDNIESPGITLDLGAGKALGNGANYFNIAVPAGTYSNLSITFTTTDECACTLKGGVTINHNTVGKLTFTGRFKPIKPSTGEASATGVGNVKWVQLWSGGPKFAEYNVGVTDGKVKSYGGYYTWGGFVNKSTDYNSGYSNLTGDDDTATNLWGSNWRMPTAGEFQALINNCHVTWTKQDDVLGCTFTGKGAYDSNSIFLPTAGAFYRGVYTAETSSYWSSSMPGGNYAANFLNLENSPTMKIMARDFNFSVRAVLAE